MYQNEVVSWAMFSIVVVVVVSTIDVVAARSHAQLVDYLIFRSLFNVYPSHPIINLFVCIHNMDVLSFFTLLYDDIQNIIKVGMDTFIHSFIHSFTYYPPFFI